MGREDRAESGAPAVPSGGEGSTEASHGATHVDSGDTKWRSRAGPILRGGPAGDEAHTGTRESKATAGFLLKNTKAALPSSELRNRKGQGFVGWGRPDDGLCTCRFKMRNGHESGRSGQSCSYEP